MVDHMVAKLGKYLRIIGCDAEWDLGLRTHELITRANAEGRVFLTRNTHLGEQYPLPAQHLLLVGTDPAQQLRLVLDALGIDPLERLFSRCIRCNVELEALADPRQAEGKVHPNVLKRYDTFFTCPRCATIFWHGTHVRNTCRKLGLGGGEDHSMIC